MKLNPDCIRDILLFLENETTHNCKVKVKSYNLTESLASYDFQELLYHIRQCDLDGFLLGVEPLGNKGYLIKDVTPKAHEFLGNIHDDTKWNTVKAHAKASGTYTLKTIFETSVMLAASNLLL